MLIALLSIAAASTDIPCFAATDPFRWFADETTRDSIHASGGKKEAYILSIATTCAPYLKRLQQHNSLRQLEIRATRCPTKVVDLGHLQHLYSVKTNALYPMLFSLPRLKSLIVEADDQGNLSLDSLARFVSLERLALNGPFARLPRSMAKLDRLRLLGLKNTLLKTLPDVISELPGLEALILHSNKGLSRLPASLREARRLTLLAIKGGNESGAFPEGLRHCASIESLEISRTNAPPAAELRHLTSLRSLELNRVKGSDSIIDNLHLVPQLESLKIGGISTLQALAAAIAAGKLASLRDLMLSGNTLRLPDEIAGLRRLRKVRLYANKLEEFPAALCELDSLTSLSIRTRRLKRIAPDIARLQTLRELSIQCDTLEQIPTAILGLRNLQRLTIKANLAPSDFPARLTALPRLQYLELGLGHNISLPDRLRDSLDSAVIYDYFDPSKTDPVFIGDIFFVNGQLFIGAGYGLYNAPRQDREWGGALTGWGTLAAGIEYKPFGRVLVAPKLSWFSTRSMFLWGMALLYYTDFREGSLVLRPQFGFNFGYHPGGARITLGVNFPISNNVFSDLSGTIWSTGLSLVW